MQSHTPSSVTQNRLFGWILIFGTFLLYAPTLFFQFLYYDDNLYIYENVKVMSGLSPDFFKWFLTANVCANWHPLTLLSHALDFQLFGMWAGGHHLTSVLFHAANTFLVFILFSKLTGSVKKSFLLAALFAWHPVKIESVAWISERKDMLSTFFALLSIWFYAMQYAARGTKNADRATYRTPRWGIKLLPLIFFALSLMSKPMYVSLPIILMLLDFWPLNRKEKWFPLLIEKIPFVVLSAISCYITVRAQSAGGAIHHFADFPPLIRFANIAQAYWDYVLLFIWPTKLSIFYPYVLNAHITRSLIIGLVLLITTITLFIKRKDAPALWTGWCLFGVMLLPVIGIVTIGAHWIACRYLYGPAIGLSIMLVWGGEMLLSKIRLPQNGIRIFVISILGFYFATASIYLGCWQNSYKLFWHAINTVPNNWIAHYNLRAAYGRDGNQEKAAEHLIETIKIFPPAASRIQLHWLDFYYMSLVHWKSGQVQQSESFLRESARLLAMQKPETLTPENLAQRNNLATCLTAFDAKNPDSCKL